MSSNNHLLVRRRRSALSYLLFFNESIEQHNQHLIRLLPSQPHDDRIRNQVIPIIRA